MRVLSVLLSASLLLLCLAGPALGKGKSERVPYAPENLIFGDDYCAFPTELQDHFAKGQYRFGDTRILAAGNFKGTIWNATPGLTPAPSLQYALAGSGKYTFNDDGTIAVQGQGKFMAWFSTAEADASPWGAGIFLMTGPISYLVDENFELIEVTRQPRHVVDVCAALTPAP